MPRLGTPAMATPDDFWVSQPPPVAGDPSTGEGAMVEALTAKCGELVSRLQVRACDGRDARAAALPWPRTHARTHARIPVASVRVVA
jgi:hypothetical protein